MNKNGIKWFEDFLMLYEETPSFKCAQRLWLMSHHFDIPLPKYILDKFVEGIEKADADWEPPEPRHTEIFQMKQFVDNHMSNQKPEGGKASKAAAIDAYVTKKLEEEDIIIDGKTIEKKLERLAIFLEDLNTR